MELKKYQLQVIKDLGRFLELLIEKQNISKAYNALPIMLCGMKKELMLE